MSQDGLSSSDTGNSGVSAGKHIPRAPVVARSLLRKGGKYDIELLTAQARDGTLRERAIVRHPGAVVILPIWEGAWGKRLVLIQSFRLSVERYLLELPAGTLEPGEQPRACAARELEEETGFIAGDIVELGSFLTSPGLSDERMWAFAARGLRQAQQRLEPDEDIEVTPVDIHEAWRMVRDGRLEDGKSLTALTLARERGVL